MPTQTTILDPSQSVFDVAVYGSGYAGFSAALALAEKGQSVLLIDRRATLLWEGAWAFHAEVGSLDAPQWRRWLNEVGARDALRNGIPDGTASEAIAAKVLRAAGVTVAWYRAPVAVEHDAQGLLAAVIMGGKHGLSRLRARRWIDTSDGRELVGLMDARAYAAAPQAQRTVLHVRRTEWQDVTDATWELPALGSVRWCAGLWANERRLEITLSDGQRHHRDAWGPALTALRERDAQCAEAIVSHASVVSFPLGYADETQPGTLPANVIAAGARGVASDTLAGRFANGLAAAGTVLSGAQAAVVANSALPALASISAREISTDVVVAGAGTGGAVAAIAAARTGAATWAVEPLPFAGGIGSGGGIHTYYFGVKGGLQEDLDDRCRSLMPMFGATRQIPGFHPDAKKLAFDALFAEAGVTWCGESTVVAVERDGRRVSSILVTTPRGPLRIRAATWIDGTGDGDLCGQAGARSSFGRISDGLPHAYTQSSGRCHDKDGLARMQMVNFDSGWVDPRDDDDLTRARWEGLIQHLQPRYAFDNRPLGISPAIGLRQGRQVLTDVTISLNDLITRRHWEDRVGFTGCHYDNHAVDYEFESDEAVFWVWGCRAWRFGRTGGEIPYRALIAADLDNVLIASRALGVSQDAHHSLRMQRDMQRIGEAAGVAAALAVSQAGAVRNVAYAALQAALVQSGALAEAGDEDAGGFGNATTRSAARTLQNATVSACVEGLRADEPWYAMWQLSQRGNDAGDAVAVLLNDADEKISWRAAVVLAARGDERAEARLLAAIATHEDGHGNMPSDSRGDHWNRMVPNWRIALALVRCCGSAACVPALQAVAATSPLPFHVATTLALTIERLMVRLPGQRAELAAIAEQLAAKPPSEGVVGEPQRSPTTYQPAHRLPGQPITVDEDRRWQFDLIVARALQQAGRNSQAVRAVYAQDPRRLVRAAFAAIPDLAQAVAS